MMNMMKVVDAVQAALKTEMREIKKIQEALRQLADEVEFNTQQFRVFLVKRLRMHKHFGEEDPKNDDAL